MNAPERFNDAAERSIVYRTFAAAFRYPGATANAFGIDGVAYNAAFDPAVNPAAASLREGAHIEEEQSALFEELVRFYEFFGLARGDGAEMPDHLCVELEFMHFLTHLEAQAAARGQAILSLRRAQQDFLMRHVVRLLHGLRMKLGAKHPRCMGLVTSCADFIRDDIEQLQKD